MYVFANCTALTMLGCFPQRNPLPNYLWFRGYAYIPGIHETLSETSFERENRRRYLFEVTPDALWLLVYDKEESPISSPQVHAVSGNTEETNTNWEDDCHQLQSFCHFANLKRVRTIGMFEEMLTFMAHRLFFHAYISLYISVGWSNTARPVTNSN